MFSTNQGRITGFKVHYGLLKTKEPVSNREEIWQDFTICQQTSCKDTDGSRVNTHIFTIDLLAAVLVNLCASEPLQDFLFIYLFLLAVDI